MEWPMCLTFGYTCAGTAVGWRIVMVIRGIVEDGQIRPLEPLPSEWVEGCELRIVDAEASSNSGDTQSWAKEMDALAAEANDPEDWARVEEVLATADAQAKAQMRREMRLP